MGVDIETYRSRIGSFNFSCRKYRQRHGKRNSHLYFYTMLLFMAIGFMFVCMNDVSNCNCHMTSQSGINSFGVLPLNGTLPLVDITNITFTSIDVHFSPYIYRLSIAYNSYCSTTNNLLLAGDISPNPGPDSKLDNNSTPVMLGSGLPSGLRISHWNIRSICNKLDQIKSHHLLHNQDSVDICGFSESWLNDSISDDYISIPGYCSERNDRCDQHGGGIIVYIKSGLSYSRRTDLEPNIESVWIELTFKNSSSILVGFIYRKPSCNLTAWSEIMETNLETAYTEDKEIMLLGDFNIDATVPNNTWSQIIDSFQLTQLVTEQTRITETSGSIIDHIYVTNTEKIRKTQVQQIFISDHFPTTIVRKNQLIKGKHTAIKYRSYKSFDEAEFIKDLQSVPWSVIEGFDNPDDILDTWNTLFIGVVDKHAPLKERRVKYPVQPEWMTDEILENIVLRDRCISTGDIVTAKVYRNKVANLTKQAKSNFYQSMLDKNKSAGEFWKYIKDLNPKQPSKSPTMLKDNNKIINNPSDIAESFNDYFANIAKMYIPVQSDNTQFDSTTLSNYINSKVPANYEFSIPTVSEEWVKKQLSSIDSKKATGPDGISARLLKSGSSAISQSLAYVINSSLRSGKMPKIWKSAKVTPIFKSGDLQDKGNYRPISVLPLLSKLIERHVAISLNEYLTHFNLLHKTQSGFRSNHSCETALTNLMNIWTTAMNKGLLNGVIYIDFRKAFDLVDHKLLLDKLKLYKCNALSTKWLSSYLTDRSQFVQFNGSKSSSNDMDVGVPQGSILGPLFFILFINDLALSIQNSALDMYADDSTLTSSSSTVELLERDLDVDLQCVKNWCDINKMVLNTGKTKSCIITTRQKRAVLKQKELNLSLGDSNLQTTKSDKLLGVFIDQDLTFKSHIKTVITKVGRSIALLRRIKKFLPPNARIKFYTAFIMPHLEYCCTIWGDSTDVLLLAKLQNRAARQILDKSYDFPSADALRLLKWLPLPTRIKQRKAVLVYKSLNELLPSYMTGMFKYVSSISTRVTRNSLLNNLYVPSYNINAYGNSLAVSGAKIWNEIPIDIRNSANVHSFSKTLYHYYLGA